MADPDSEKETTRLIAIGPTDLVQGFALIGFEPVADATEEDLDRALTELLDSGQRALVLIETGLAQADSPALHRIQSQGGRIVVAWLPRLGTAAQYRSPVEDLIARVLGPRALERHE